MEGGWLRMDTARACGRLRSYAGVTERPAVLPACNTCNACKVCAAFRDSDGHRRLPRVLCSATWVDYQCADAAGCCIPRYIVLDALDCCASYHRCTLSCWPSTASVRLPRRPNPFLTLCRAMNGRGVRRLGAKACTTTVAAPILTLTPLG